MELRSYVTMQVYMVLVYDVQNVYKKYVCV